MNINAITNTNEHYVIPIAKKNEEFVRTMIHKNDHPHPTLLIIIIIVILLLIYYLYINVIKKNFSGEWYSAIGKLIKIRHNPWNDYIYIDDIYRGYSVGNAIYLDSSTSPIMGIFNNKKIYFIGTNEIWSKPVNST
jgi:hypothetical protein